ncbi:hypothetical protein AURDEDRAFT_167275 [Auricularia subglabra TFB-10046 SS5]|nr:hypothetical protein AURDEDRAFT_167275 [Auricularia subglabra TFB-10046 SS5]
MASPQASSEVQSQQTVAQLLAGMSGMQSEPNHSQAGPLDQTQLLSLLKQIPGVFNKEHPRDPNSAERQPSREAHPFADSEVHIEADYRDDDDGEGDDGSGGNSPRPGKRKRGKNEHGTEEWARQRKDNHKEVERRRRGNINEGINELGRIVPNASGEKAKGAILSRAVQYIHHLKDNEARNIEKWTLEKLLMDQAMSDLQAS